MHLIIAISAISCIQTLEPIVSEETGNWHHWKMENGKPLFLFSQSFWKSRKTNENSSEDVKLSIYYVIR